MSYYFNESMRNDILKNIDFGAITVIIATTNDKKIELYKQFLNYFGYISGIKLPTYSIPEIDSSFKMDCPEPYYEFKDNAALKASYLYYKINEKELTGSEFVTNDNYIIIANDSGLRISELGGWPDIKTARAYKDVYAPELGNKLTSAEAIIYQMNKHNLPTDSWINSNYDVDKVHATSVSSTCILTHTRQQPNYRNNIHTETKFQEVAIIDPRTNESEVQIKTMWDITTPIRRYDDDTTQYDLKPISKLSIETLMLLGDPMFESFMECMYKALDDFIDNPDKDAMEYPNSYMKGEKRYENC